MVPPIITGNPNVNPTTARNQRETPDGSDPASGASRSFREALSDIERAERSVDRAVRRASRGADLSAGELLALQSRVNRASQQAELVAKTVDRVSDTVREITQMKV